MPLDPAVIAETLRLPAGVVAVNWSLITAALDEQGVRSDLVEIAAAATIGVEVPHFEPICEMGGLTYLSRYDYNTVLGNTEPGDGARFKGRGFVQLTGRSNYAAAGQALGLFLLDSPELALEPTTAARILAWFFRTHQVADAAEARDWRRVRQLVNGGQNGWDHFSALVEALCASTQTTPMTTTPMAGGGRG